MEKYKKFETVGHGSGGWVYRGIKCETNEPVALKQIYLLEGNEGIPSSIIREISFLQEMDHSNIVRLLDVVEDNKRVYLVLEYMDLDLKKFMDTRLKIAKTPHMIKSFLYQILSGLTYCHSHKILHRDLKPQNLLVSSSNTLKLADFGSAREFGVPAKSFTPGEHVATLWYKAPELIFGSKNYSTAVDVWSVGCIFAEMVNQKPLFAEASDLYQSRKIFSILGTPNETNWPGVSSLCEFVSFFGKNGPKNLAEVVPGLEPAGVDLLTKMLCLNPRGRITACEALKHAYFEDLERP